MRIDERRARTHRRGGGVMAADTEPAKKMTLTVEEAAEMIGISRAQAYRCVKRGELRAVQLGRRLVVPVIALEHLLGMPVANESSPES